MQEEIIQRVLSHGASRGADPAGIARAAARALRLLFGELQPLVGTQAALALYSRSLHLTRSSFHWIPSRSTGPGGDLLADLERRLASHPTADDVRCASEALLRNFADLLVSLIGEPLTFRLLHSAWDISDAGDPIQENAHE